MDQLSIDVVQMSKAMRDFYHYRVLVIIICCISSVSCTHVSDQAAVPALDLATANEVHHDLPIEKRIALIAALLRQEHQQLHPIILRVARIGEEIDSLLRQLDGILVEFNNILAHTTKDSTSTPPTVVPLINTHTPPAVIEPAIKPPHHDATNTPAIEHIKPKSEPPVSVVVSTGRFYLHIASYLSADTANRQWVEFQQHHPTILGDLTPHFSAVVDQHGKHFTRMMGGSLTERSEADLRCRKLENLGIYCKVISLN